MKETNANWQQNESGDSRIERAERAVTGSLERLESAMETLTGKVETSGQKIRHVLDLGARQRDELLRLRDQATSTLLPVIERGRVLGGRAVASVRRDPRPFLLGALAVVGTLLFLSFRARRAARAGLPGVERGYSESSSAFLIDEPDTWAA